MSASESESVQAAEKRPAGAPAAGVKPAVSVAIQRKGWLKASLAQRSGENPTAIQTAEAVVSMWEEIATALHPVIGRQGVTAMYDRSVALTTRLHPWMAGTRGGGGANSLVDLAALQAVVVQQDNNSAAGGTTALLQTFYEVLVSLIGCALGDELLRTVRERAVDRVSREIRNL